MTNGRRKKKLRNEKLAPLIGAIQKALNYRWCDARKYYVHRGVCKGCEAAPGCSGVKRTGEEAAKEVLTAYENPIKSKEIG